MYSFTKPGSMPSASHWGEVTIPTSAGNLAGTSTDNSYTATTGPPFRTYPASPTAGQPPAETVTHGYIAGVRPAVHLGFQPAARRSAHALHGALQGRAGRRSAPPPIMLITNTFDPNTGSAD